MNQSRLQYNMDEKTKGSRKTQPKLNNKRKKKEENNAQ